MFLRTINGIMLLILHRKIIPKLVCTMLQITQTFTQQIQFIILCLLLLLSFSCLVRYSIQRAAHRAIFIPSSIMNRDPSCYQLPFEDVFFSTKDGLTLHGWYIEKPQAIATLLFLHGNAGNISNRLEELLLLHKIDLNVFIIDYRGYGKSHGRPSIQGLCDDAVGAYRYLIEDRKVAPEQIVCFGRSLGGAIAVHLASRYQLGALILASTFSSMQDVIAAVFPSKLVWLLQKLNPLNLSPISNIDAIRCPLLVVHGEKDTLLPSSLGKKLYDVATTSKMWYIIPNAGHNDIFIRGGKKYWYLLKAFILKTIQRRDVSNFTPQDLASDPIFKNKSSSDYGQET